MKQRQGESLKNYLNRFRVFTVKLQTQDEPLMVHAFRQGLTTGSFSDSLIRNPARTFGEIRCQVVAHIGAEEAVSMKHNSIHPKQAKPKEGSRARPLRVHEVVTEKMSNARRAPYSVGKNQPRTKAKEDLAF